MNAEDPPPCIGNAAPPTLSHQRHPRRQPPAMPYTPRAFHSTSPPPIELPRNLPTSSSKALVDDNDTPETWIDIRIREAKRDTDYKIEP